MTSVAMNSDEPVSMKASPTMVFTLLTTTVSVLERYQMAPIPVVSTSAQNGVMIGKPKSLPGSRNGPGNGVGTDPRVIIPSVCIYINQ